jgi:hypothetical protein
VDVLLQQWPETNSSVHLANQAETVYSSERGVPTVQTGQLLVFAHHFVCLFAYYKAELVLCNYPLALDRFAWQRRARRSESERDTHERRSAGQTRLERKCSTISNGAFCGILS